MDNQLKYLLFKQIVNHEDGSIKPLFRFQSELAQAIGEVDKNYKADKIRPYLNQTLKYDGITGKPMSSQLKNAIINASKNRLDPESELFETFERKFEEAYLSMSNSENVKNFPSDQQEFELLSSWQSKSNRTVVLSREPLEVKYLDPDYEDDFEGRGPGDLLQSTLNNLLKNYSIDGKESLTLRQLCTKLNNNEEFILSSINRNEQYFFRYYVSSFNVARKLWQGLIKFISDKILDFQEFNDRQAYELAIMILELINGSSLDLRQKLNNLPNNSYEISFLKVFKTSGYLLTIPVVYYECANGIIDERTKELEHEMLFSLIVDINGKKSVSMVKGQDLEFWKEEVYYPLYWSENKPFNVEDINLFKALSHINRTTKKNVNEQSKST